MKQIELENGVVIYQVTDENRMVSNIYCERPYCSRDSRRFLCARQVNDVPLHYLWEYNIIATVRNAGEYVSGNIVILAKGVECRRIAAGTTLIHIGSTPCGKYFYGDRIARDFIVIGSAATGKTVIVHDDPADPGPSRCLFGQLSHPHAYLSPDFKWMVFNSDRTGRPQVYAANIPPVLLEKAEKNMCKSIIDRIINSV
jgi:hypothetical protein